MVRDEKSSNLNKSKWLVDDVISFNDNNGKVVGYSQKEAMNEFVDEAFGARAYVPTEEEEMFDFQNGIIESGKENLSLHHFIGQIAGAKIHMSIMVDGLMAQGRYYYDSKWAEGDKASLSLYGNYNGGNLRLTEFVNNEVTGVFEGEWNNEIYEGTFTRMKDGKGIPFRLFETEGGADFFTEYEIVAE